MLDQAEIHIKCISKKTEDRREAAELLKKNFPSLPDKNQAWQDLLSLIQGKDPSAQRIAARTLKEAFNQVPDKGQSWQDLLQLMRIQDSLVRLEVGRALDLALDQISDEKQFRSDFIELVMYEPFRAAEEQRKIILERFEASGALKKAFSHVNDNEWTLLALIDLMRESYSFVNPEDIKSFQPLASGRFLPQFRINRNRSEPMAFIRIDIDLLNAPASDRFQ